MEKWLEELKVGDKVLVRHYNSYNVKMVHRTTKTQIIFTDDNGYETKYRRNDGMLIRGDDWHNNHIKEWTQEKEDIIKVLNR